MGAMEPWVLEVIAELIGHRTPDGLATRVPVMTA